MSYDGMPPGYAEIFQQLDQLNARGSNAASNAAKYRSIAEKSREGLNGISEKVQELSDIIKALKGLLANLSRTNVDLQTRLDQINRECDAKVARAVEKMEEETQAVRQKCEEEKRQLQAETIANSDMEKRKALAELDQQAKTQIEEIQKASMREIESIKAEQLNLNERILNALKNVARNQEIVITGLESALTEGDPDQLNGELSSIQQQVLSLLESIKVELETSMTGTLPPPPPSRPFPPLPPPRHLKPIQDSNETLATNSLVAPPPQIDLSNETEVLPLTSSSNDDEKFQYMMKTLNNAKLKGALDEINSTSYQSILNVYLRNWSELSSSDLTYFKNRLYRGTRDLYNKMYPSYPINYSSESMQRGGKSRKHRKVHFKTRGGGKKRGKRTKRHKKAKRSHTKRH